MYNMRRTFLVSVLACSLFSAWAVPARAAAPTYPVGTYAWVTPPIAGDGGDMPAGVRFPFNPTSGYAGVIHAVFDIAPGQGGDGHVWQPADQRGTTTNLVPTFCVQQGAAVRFDTWYVVPGTTATITLGPFSQAGATVTGSGPGLTVTASVTDGDKFVELPVAVPASAPLGTPITLTAVSGADSFTATITPSDPYMVKNWSVSRAAAPANMNIAAWIAAHADTYSAAGVKGATYGAASANVPTTVLTASNAANESLEAAAAQLAIWQVLANKNVVAGTPAASSPIADYSSAAPHDLNSQLQGNGGTFATAPTQNEVDVLVVNRAKELFIAATGDGIIGGSDDQSINASAHTPVISVSVGATANGSTTLTVTGTRTSTAGISEPLSGATVTLTGADFDPATAGVQSGTVTLSAAGTATATAVVTGAAQPVTASATVAVPAGALLAVSSDNGPSAAAPAFQLQQLITASASTTKISAGATIGANGTAVTTTVPAQPKDTPNRLPYSGPLAPLAAITAAIFAGAVAIVLRRRFTA
jgi:hypothetical protein